MIYKDIYRSEGYQYFPIICCFQNTHLYVSKKIWEEPEESMPTSTLVAISCFCSLYLSCCNIINKAPYLRWEAGSCPADRTCIWCSLTKLFEIFCNHIHYFPLSISSGHQAFFLVLTTFVHHTRALEEFRNYFFCCCTALAAFLLITL